MHKTDRTFDLANAGSLIISRRDLLRFGGVAGMGLMIPAVFTGCGSSNPASYSNTIADARRAIKKVLVDTNTPSITVALIDGEHTIWAEAFGRTDQAGTTPSPETMFAIASGSKVVAAIATMILVDRGLVGLDTPLVDYIKDFRMASPEYTQITVRMLLNHSSGLSGSDNSDGSTFGPVTGFAKRLKVSLASQRLKHTPGEMAVYCNDGFTITELLIEAITGKPYTIFVEDEILAPLGMSNSRFTTVPFKAGSWAPAFRDDGTPHPLECMNIYASGGLYTTPSDMGRLARMLINRGRLDGRRILTEWAVAEMGIDQIATLPLNPKLEHSIHFGLGWDSVIQRGLAAVGVRAWVKNGGSMFYGSDFYLLPDERLALMVIGTSPGYGGGGLAQIILLNALAERGTIAAIPAPLPTTPLPEKTANSSDLAAIEGIYGKYDGLKRIEAQADKTLTISNFDAGKWTEQLSGVKMRSDGTFSADILPGTAFRSVYTATRHYLIVRSPGDLPHYTSEIPLGQRLEVGETMTKVWNSRVNKQWLPVNVDARMTLLVTGVTPRFSLHSIPGLPAHLAASAPLLQLQSQPVETRVDDNNIAYMCMKIPAEYGRELYDLVIENRNGEEWVLWASTLFRPQESVPSLSPNTGVDVTIGIDGFAEWLVLPPSGRITINGATHWFLYNAGFGLLESGEANRTVTFSGRGSKYLMLHGTVRSSIYLNFSS